VGTVTLQLAAGTGATVIATARPDGEALVRGLGASGVVDYTGDLASAITSVAPGGVTAVGHAAGDAAVLGGLLRPGGRIASVIGATAEQVGRADVTVIPVHASPTQAKLRALLEAIAAGRLQVPVDRTFALADAAAALTAFGQHKRGKLIITLD
jgi:NADPH:quinone reductase-like Zn-dependent oxidoreductase